VVLTLLAAAVPLPGSGWDVLRGSPRATTDLRASRQAILKDGGVQGEGAPSEGEAAAEAKSRPSSPGKAEGSGPANDREAAPRGAAGGRRGGAPARGRPPSGAPRGRPPPARAGTPGQRGPSRDQDGGQAKAQEGHSPDPADRGKDAGQDSSRDEPKASGRD